MFGWLGIGLSACGLPAVPQHPAELRSTAEVPWDTLVDTPGPVAVDTLISARWEVPLHGLVNLDDPAAQGLEDGAFPIVLPVTLFVHPTAGVFAIDSGIDSDRAQGGRGPARGLVGSFLGKMVPVEPLAEILAHAGRPVAGLLLTHTHIDHVLGLQDLPPGTPVYVGQGELRERGLVEGLTRSTYKAAFDGITLSVFDPATAVALGDLTGWDLVGDGSIWALASPGHTPGSTAYLARTPEGPVLAVGDTSHTFWGWANGVPPGTYTEDQAMNAESLGKLRDLAARHPTMRVLVGHQVIAYEPPVAAIE